MTVGQDVCMGNEEVRVEVDPREVRFLRSEKAAAQLGCPPLLVVPIDDVLRAVALPGPRGARHLRVEATGQPAAGDVARDPLSAVFPKRQAGDAENLAAMISRNVAVHRGDHVAPPQVGLDPKLEKAIHRSSAVALWAANLSLVLLVIPVLVFLILLGVIFVALL